MGIEPTSEAWEAYLKRENARIGGIFAFFDSPQMDSNWSVTALDQRTKPTRGRIGLAQLASSTTGICCCSFPAICCSLLSLGMFFILLPELSIKMIESCLNSPRSLGG